MASRGLLAVPSGDRRLTIAHVADVVRAVIAVGAVGRVAGTYHVGATEAVAMDAMLREIAEAGGVTARLVHFPPWVLRVAGNGASALRALGIRRLPLSRDKVEEILARHWVLETRTSIDQLGLQEPLPFGVGARMTWQWYRNAGWL
jgi:nucleoside-diphosphate-sugar epimerase